MSPRKKSRPEIAARLERFFNVLERGELDGALLDQRDDIHYFTGYSGSDAVLLLAAGRRRGWLITDSRYREEAEASAPGVETVIWKNGFAAFVGKAIRRHRLCKLGHTPASLSLAFFEAMRVESGFAVSWRSVGPDIAALRAIKDATEVAAIGAALRCAEDAFTAARKRWRVGMTEREVKNDLEWEMRARGAEDAAFETIVAAGANASLPHAHAGEGKIRPGKMLLIDFGARVGRYNSDLTRTLWPGAIPGVWAKRLQVVLAAQRAGIEAVAAGVPRARPENAARRVMAEAGLEEFFIHSLGHGVGLAVHEEPRLGRKAMGVLAAGNVVTAEPGLYFPGAGGIRIEDMVLVTESGARVLSSLPREPESLVF